MEFQIAVDPDTGWGRVTISGEITHESLEELLEAAWTHPEYSRAETAIWNFLDARTDLRLADLMQVTSWIAAEKSARGATNIALVASDNLTFGVSRMFQAIQPETGWSLGVFRDEAAAVRWLANRDQN
jgi:hypothetical protein